MKKLSLAIFSVITFGMGIAWAVPTGYAGADRPVRAGLEATPPQRFGLEAGVSVGVRAKAEIRHFYGEPSLVFMGNAGEADKSVKYLATGKGFSLLLKPNEAVLWLLNPKKRSGQDTMEAAGSDCEETALKMRLEGANKGAGMVGQGVLSADATSGTSDFFAGMKAGLTAYSQVCAQDVYPGINLVYYGKRPHRLEYDFVVSPGADPSDIKINFDGADSVTLDKEGNLILGLAGAQIVHFEPFIYQELDGRQVPVEGRFVLLGGSRVGFGVSAYDRSRPLIIDPAISFKTCIDVTETIAHK